MTPRASKKQQELLQFIDGFIQGHGYGPSYREVMRALGYKSVSTVAAHVDQLIVKGYLEKKDNSARSLSVVALRPQAPVALQEKDQAATVHRVINEKIRELELKKDTDAVEVLRKALDILSAPQNP